ncbi:MAG: flagellar basal body P-ring formation chaperone FlgA [Candidatus Accumulibacter propinquus]
MLSAAMSNTVDAQTSLPTALDHYLRIQTQGLPGKVSYSIGKLDQHTQLAACSAFEPFLPPGSRLWGNATVGIRCLGPSAWTVYVPVQVRIAGNYLLTARRLTPGQIVTTTDVVTQSGDLGALPASILTDPAQAIGKTVRNGVAAGQPLRGDRADCRLGCSAGTKCQTVDDGHRLHCQQRGKGAEQRH